MASWRRGTPRDIRAAVADTRIAPRRAGPACRRRRRAAWPAGRGLRGFHPRRDQADEGRGGLCKDFGGVRGRLVGISLRGASGASSDIRSPDHERPKVCNGLWESDARNITSKCRKSCKTSVACVSESSEFEAEFDSRRRRATKVGIRRLFTVIVKGYDVMTRGLSLRAGTDDTGSLVYIG